MSYVTRTTLNIVHAHIFSFISRLYKESARIHATHAEDILKRKSYGDAVAGDQDDQVLIWLQAGAFRSLCQHLRERSDEVQNIDLMGLSGFCRNCLAKVCLSIMLPFYHYPGSILSNNGPTKVARHSSSKDL